MRPSLKRHAAASGAVAAAIAAASAACGSNSISNSAGQPLTPDATGWVDRSTTGTTGIEGPWYAFTDGASCLPRHAPAECSTLVTPDPAAPFFGPTGDLGMCAVGVVSQVIVGADGSTLDWSNMWGARIAFDFNQDADYDAPAHGVTGLAFHIDAAPPRGAEMQVLFSTAPANVDLAGWGGAPGGGAADTSPVHAGRNDFRWGDVGGPSYLTNPPPFDPTHLRSIQFGVKADELVAKSFAFCIRGLTALTD